MKKNLSVLCMILSLLILVVKCSTLPVEERAEKHRVKGVEYMEKWEGKEALAELNKAIEIKPDFAMAYYNRGLLAMKYYKRGLLLVGSQYELGISDFQKALDIDPNFKEASDANVFLARERYGGLDKALMYANRAIEIDNNQEAIKVRNEILKDQKQAKSNKIKKIALQGERNGIRIELQIGLAGTGQMLEVRSYHICCDGRKLRWDMAIYSNRNIKLNSFADDLTLSIDGKMCRMELTSLCIPGSGWIKSHNCYPTMDMLKNTTVEFKIHSYTDAYDSVFDLRETLKEMIVGHIEDPKKFPMSKIQSVLVSKRVQCQYKIGSLSLTIPLNKVIFEYDK